MVISEQTDCIGMDWIMIKNSCPWVNIRLKFLSRLWRARFISRILIWKLIPMVFLYTVSIPMEHPTHMPKYFGMTVIYMIVAQKKRSQLRFFILGEIVRPFIDIPGEVIA